MKLGDRLEDPITGFVGIATATMEHLHGRVEFQLTAKDADDGNPQVRWFDAPRLVPATETATIGSFGTVCPKCFQTHIPELHCPEEFWR